MYENQLQKVIDGLNERQRAEYKAKYPNIPQDEIPVWITKQRKKFIAIDCGGSGAFLVEKTTGELFNIKGYGVPDYNKKKKADIGNVKTVDPVWLWSKRFNYLR